MAGFDRGVFGARAGVDEAARSAFFKSAEQGSEETNVAVQHCDRVAIGGIDARGGEIEDDVGTDACERFGEGTRVRSVDLDGRYVRVGRERGASEGIFPD